MPTATWQARAPRRKIPKHLTLCWKRQWQGDAESGARLPVRETLIRVREAVKTGHRIVLDKTDSCRKHVASDTRGFFYVLEAEIIRRWKTRETAHDISAGSGQTRVLGVRRTAPWKSERQPRPLVASLSSRACRSHGCSGSGLWRPERCAQDVVSSKFQDSRAGNHAMKVVRFYVRSAREPGHAKVKCCGRARNEKMCATSEQCETVPTAVHPTRCPTMEQVLCETRAQIQLSSLKRGNRKTLNTQNARTQAALGNGCEVWTDTRTGQRCILTTCKSHTIGT